MRRTKKRKGGEERTTEYMRTKSRGIIRNRNALQNTQKEKINEEHIWKKLSSH